MKCPRCESEQIVKNGRIHNGKQNYRCRNCGRQFVEQPKWRAISKETKKRIDKLMLEKLPLAGIARVEGVSETWLQSYVNQKYQQVEQQVTVGEKKGL
jgi:insertion element IS1 protein InsB